MVDQLPQEARFLSTHGHTRVLIVGIHWPSWVNDGKPYAAEKLLRDLTLVQPYGNRTGIKPGSPSQAHRPWAGARPG